MCELKKDPPPARRKLADTRTAKTHKFNVSGYEGYMTVGLYEDGTPGELFITMSKEGSTIGGLVDGIATITSVSLRYGVPLEVLVKKFVRTRFEPSGFTRNPDIKNATSILDYVFRWMGHEFIPGFKEKDKPPGPPELTPTG
jgi:ribonucleoside-diphosphate reductase alpha chain